MKMRIEAQQLQPGDIVGSGEVVLGVIIRSLSWTSKECLVRLNTRDVLWGRYTMINIDRPDDKMVTSFQIHEPKSWNGFSRK